MSTFLSINFFSSCFISLGIVFLFSTNFRLDITPLANLMDCFLAKNFPSFIFITTTADFLSIPIANALILLSLGNIIV